MTARIHLGWGLLLLLRTRTCMSLCQAPVSGSAILLIRVLGLRHMAEGVALAAVRSPDAPRWCGLVDAAHAVTMAGLAACQPPYRRAARLSLAVSGVLAVSEYRASGSDGSPRCCRLLSTGG